MNTDILYKVLKAIAEDFRTTNLQTHLKELVTGLANQQNSPNADHLQQITNAMNALRKRLRAAASNKFPKTWDTTLEELGVENFLGDRLFERLSDIMGGNQITVNAAHDQISKLYQQITDLQAAITKILEGLEAFDLEPDDLPTSDGEVSILIPRDLFSNELGEFAEELEELDRIVATLSEAATGQRESARIDQISTTDPLLILWVNPATVLFLLKALNMLLDAYEKVMRIRKISHEMKQLNLRDQTLDAVKAEAREALNAAIDGFIVDMRPNLPVKKDGRQHEIENELRIRLTNLAARIDRGYRIDADIKVLPPAKEGEEEPEGQQQARSQGQEIRDLSTRVRYFEPEGEPILNLPKRSSPEKPSSVPPA